MRIIELNIEITALLNEFVNEEWDLLEEDVSEQAISSRLARKFELVSHGWNVDCEYNRDQGTIKTLKYTLSENGDIEKRNVVPDIIVHHRRTNDNLLAIEVKKVGNRENRFKDEAKLKAFREQLGYKYTLFVDLKTGKNPSIESVVFHDGN
jgi:hypothetical protein